MKVVTLTLNPALDKSTFVDKIVADKKLRCDKPRFQPGGGGVNVSRAMRQLGHDSLAIYAAGGPEGMLFSELLKESGIIQDVITIKDRTRENFMVVNTSTNEQFRFGMPGPTLEKEEYELVRKKVEMLPESTEYFVASGSLPLGVPADFYAELASITKKKGIRFVCDTSGDALEAALEEGIYLIKPNVSELYQLLKMKNRYGHETAELASELIAQGKSEMVAVSLGSKGAMLVDDQGYRHAIPPSLEVRSTIGAGDSMVAGMMIGLMHGKSKEDVIKMGVSAGSAATMNSGTDLSQKEDYDYLLKVTSVSSHQINQ